MPYRKRQQKGNPELIGDILKTVVGKLDDSKHKQAEKIFSAWRAVAGKAFCAHSRPVSLKKGTLQVMVEDSAWFYQANLEKQQLIKELSKKMAGEIKDLRFKIGKI